MPKDAKLGLVVGIGLVILIAVVFFRKETGPVPGGSAAAVSAAGPSSSPTPRGQYRPVRAKPAERTAGAELSASSAGD